MKRLNLPGKTFIYIDTLRLARQKIKEVKWHKLPILKKYLKLDYDSHFAEDDCYVCHEVYKYCRGLYSVKKVPSIENIEETKNLNLYSHLQLSETEIEILIEQAKSFEKFGYQNEAINLYEQCIASHCINKMPYDRLILLYRKKRQKENEVRVLQLALQIFKLDKKYQIRLDKIQY